MASLFMVPKSPKSPPRAKENPELGRAMINRERHRQAGGSYAETIAASGLKTSTGA
jgi:hypothetical protein